VRVWHAPMYLLGPGQSNRSDFKQAGVNMQLCPCVAKTRHWQSQQHLEEGLAKACVLSFVTLSSDAGTGLGVRANRPVWD
jgi:predicted peroxiredoxin